MGPGTPDKNRRQGRRRDGGGSQRRPGRGGAGAKDATTQGGTPPSENERRQPPGKELLLNAFVPITCNSNSDAAACLCACVYTRAHAAPLAPSLACTQRATSLTESCGDNWPELCRKSALCPTRASGACAPHHHHLTSGHLPGPSASAPQAQFSQAESSLRCSDSEQLGGSAAGA